MNKKAALIFIGNIEFCPYIKEYEQILEELHIDYDVIFWKREDLRSKYPGNYRYFSHPSSLQRKKYLKLIDFARYACWLKKTLKNRHYTHLVFLDTLSGVLGYLTGSMSQNMHGILEIRDYTYEKIRLFQYIEHKMMAGMDQVFISSRAFCCFLPTGNYCITHNFNTKEYTQFCSFRRFARKANGETLNIVYTGALKYFNYQKAILEEFKNDDRFHIFFHGIGPDYEKLRQYCRDKKIRNVTFTGLYVDEQKAGFYDNADFLLNCYDVNLGSEVRYAVSNKYYDGLIYHIPQLSESKTYKGHLIERDKTGITWRPGEGKLKGMLIKFYFSIDESSFNKICVERMEKYYAEYKKYVEKIVDFFESY